MSMEKLKQRVYGDLDNAVANGYEADVMRPADEVAADLADCTDLDAEAGVLEELVQAWQMERG